MKTSRESTPQSANSSSPDVAKKTQVARATDFIHRTLIPESARLKVDFLTQIMWMHKVHLGGDKDFQDQGTRHNGVGVIRSQDGIFSSNVGVVDSVTKKFEYLAPDKKDVGDLLVKLLEKTEKVFGEDRKKITADNIYHLLSVIQFAFVAIHPFIDANGRVSEDMLYALWEKVPKRLRKRTIRYPSSDGLRGHDDNAAMRRDHLLVTGLHALMRNVSKNAFGLEEVDNFWALEEQVLKRFRDQGAPLGLGANFFEKKYDEALKTAIEYYINLIDVDRVSQIKEHHSVMNDLAENLRNSPSRYQYDVEQRKGTELQASRRRLFWRFGAHAA